MSNNANYNNSKVVTGKVRFSYVNVFEAKSINGSTPKYSVSLIIPKDDTNTLKKIEAAIEAAYKNGESKLKRTGRTVPALSVIKTPLRDGDLERPDDEAYANSFFIRFLPFSTSVDVYSAARLMRSFFYTHKTRRLLRFI